jgi:hypothetical protein
LKIWKADFLSAKFHTQAHFADIGKVRNLKFYSLDSWGSFPDITLTIEPPYPPADFLTCGPIRVVSEKLMQTLVSHPGVLAEFFPLDVIYAGQLYTETNYYCLHILDGVECLDFERSKFSVDPEKGWVDAIDKLVIDESKVVGHELFRITDVDFIIECASEQLAERITAAKFTGVRFFEPTELRW